MIAVAMLSGCPFSAGKALENRGEDQTAEEGNTESDLGAFLDESRELLELLLDLGAGCERPVRAAAAGSRRLGRGG